MAMNLIYCVQANCPVATKEELFDATARRHVNVGHAGRDTTSMDRSVWKATARRHVNVGHAGRDTTSMDRSVWKALAGQTGLPRFVSGILHQLQDRIGTSSKALRPAEHF